MTKISMQTWGESLIKWYMKNKRDLPWRKTSDPYCIWISEVMLQQTRVDTVVPYYNRFITRYPRITDLASAEREHILKMWQGLGYYSRAHNMHRAAKQIIETHRGNFPENYIELLKLPGFGIYTAAAVASIAFNEPIPAVDGNVRRVISRYLGMEERSVSRGNSLIFDYLVPHIESSLPKHFNQALMELGAVVCHRRSPECVQCPIRCHCVAKKKNLTDRIPYKRKKRLIPTYEYVIGVILDGEKVLLRRRTHNEMLGGLWGFPGGRFANATAADKYICDYIRDNADIRVKFVKIYGKISHVYSHFKMNLHVAKCDFSGGRMSQKYSVADHNDFVWINVPEIHMYPFDQASIKAIQLIAETEGLPIKMNPTDSNSN